MKAFLDEAERHVRPAHVHRWLERAAELQILTGLAEVLSGVWADFATSVAPRDNLSASAPQVRAAGPQPYRGLQLAVAQWASLVPVRVLARLRIGPGDFPFLGQIHAHDPQVIKERAARDPDGFPWLDDYLQHTCDSNQAAEEPGVQWATLAR